MISPLHTGVEPTLPRWLSAGWKEYYITVLYHNMHMQCEGHPLNLSTLVLYDICICTVKVCESHPLNLSTFTLHGPQTFSHLFHTFCMYNIPCQDMQNYQLLLLTARWQGNKVSMVQHGQRGFQETSDCKGSEPGNCTTNGTPVRRAIHCSITSTYLSANILLQLNPILVLY